MRLDTRKLKPIERDRLRAIVGTSLGPDRYERVLVGGPLVEYEQDGTRYQGRYVPVIGALISEPIIPIENGGRRA